mmetsp:Transcript_44377/g.140019  ORF Transcript_44377/g.140019 Transcript_44377/m.140019 type:complete len:272 (+) Transcript_44377:228-1043(+)
MPSSRWLLGYGFILLLGLWRCFLLRNCTVLSAISTPLVLLFFLCAPCTIGHLPVCFSFVYQPQPYLSSPLPSQPVSFLQSLLELSQHDHSCTFIALHADLSLQDQREGSLDLSRLLLMVHGDHRAPRVSGWRMAHVHLHHVVLGPDCHSISCNLCWRECSYHSLSGRVFPWAGSDQCCHCLCGMVDGTLPHDLLCAQEQEGQRFLLQVQRFLIRTFIPRSLVLYDLFIFDMNGYHFYIILSPRTHFCFLSYSLMLGIMAFIYYCLGGRFEL